MSEFVLPDHKTAMQFHGEIEKSIRKRYGFPEIMKARWIANRKNIQIALLSDPLQLWEIEAMKKGNLQHNFSLHREMIMEVVRKEFLASVSTLYPGKAEYFYLFEPSYHQKNIYTFTFKIFDAPIFKAIDSFQVAKEERIVNLLAQSLKKRNGHGPQKIQAAILGKDYLGVVVSKLFPDVLTTDFQSDMEKRKVFEAVNKQALRDAIEEACLSEDEKISEIFIEHDFVNNLWIVLAAMKPLQIGDFLRES